MKHGNRGTMLSHIAIRLAGEGVPINVIARAMLESSGYIREDLARAVSRGVLKSLPAEDWADQKGVRRPAPPQSTPEEAGLIAYKISAKTRFTNQQSLFIAVLMTNEVALHPTIMAAISPSVLASPNIIKVVACQVRPALRKMGVEFETVWGEGYRLDPKGRQRLQALIDGDRSEGEAAFEKAA